MEISLRRGLVEAGLTACISSFCLLPVTAWPQNDSEANPPIAPEGAPPDWAAAQRIEEHQQTLLRAVERIHEHSRAALDRYTDTILSQFQLLQESFASQRAELNALQQINHSTRAIVLAMMVIALVSLLVLAWIPLWATSRMSKRILGVARRRAGVLAPFADTLDTREVLSLESMVERLENRLLALQHSPSSTASSQAFKTPAPAATPPRAPETPRVTLRMGEGSALFFVPHEGPSGKVNALRRHWARVKKLLARSPAAQKT